MHVDIQDFHLKNMKQFILKKNFMYVDVVKPLDITLHFSYSKEHIEEKIVMNVNIAVKPFCGIIKLKIMKTFILEKNPINVNSVG